MAVDREELAWAAGFFDGEGTTNAYMQSSRPHLGTVLQLTISQVDRRTLERFLQAVGVGKIYYIDRSEGNPIHTFKVSRFELVQHVVAQLWPWLSDQKKEQATKAFRSYLDTNRKAA